MEKLHLSLLLFMKTSLVLDFRQYTVFKNGFLHFGSDWHPYSYMLGISIFYHTYAVILATSGLELGIWYSGCQSLVKFIYSEKATKFCEIFPLLLTVCTVVKSEEKIRKILLPFQNIWILTYVLGSSSIWMCRILNI